MSSRIGGLTVALTLALAARGGAATTTETTTQVTTTLAETTTTVLVTTTTAAPTSTTTVPPTTTTTRPLPPPPAITGDDGFIVHTERALAVLREKAPDAYIHITEWIDTIRQVQRGSGMDVVNKTFLVGESTAHAPGWPENDQVVWYAGTIAHDSYHSLLYGEESTFAGRDAELACLEFQLEVLEAIEANPSFITYIQDIIEGIDDPENQYWNNPDRHW